MYLITDYGLRPSVGAHPSQSGAIEASMVARDRSTLVVFLHPRCPCSRATVEELGRVMQAVGGSVTARVILIKPADTSEDWAQTELARQAAAIPGVEVLVDIDGTRAKAAGAATSGQALLYNREERLIFSGGLTAARGHFGANAASDQLIQAVRQPTGEVIVTPAFGCPLEAPRSSSD